MNFNTALHDFLTQWAEDEFWVGHLLTKKIYEYGPDLEENIAIGSISQDEIGHCRMLLSLITTSEKQMDDLIYGKQPEQMRVSQLAEYWYDYDWASLVMKQLIYDASDSVRLAFARLIPDSQFQNVLDMMKREENVHLEHWMEWAVLIAQDDKGKRYLQKAVDHIYPLLSDFFADPLYARVAQEYGINPVSTEFLLKQTMEMLNSRVEQLGLKVPSAESTMIDRLTVKGGRYGLHSANFVEFYNEYTSIYRLNPDMIWG